MSTQKASKEPILEEAELEFRPLEECEEGLEDEESPETKEAEAQREAVHKGPPGHHYLGTITCPRVSPSWTLKSPSLSQRCQERQM